MIIIVAVVPILVHDPPSGGGAHLQRREKADAQRSPGEGEREDDEALKGKGLNGCARRAETLEEAVQLKGTEKLLLLHQLRWNLGSSTSHASRREPLTLSIPSAFATA